VDGCGYESGYNGRRDRIPKRVLRENPGTFMDSEACLAYSFGGRGGNSRGNHRGDYYYWIGYYGYSPGRLPCFGTISEHCDRELQAEVGAVKAWLKKAWGYVVAFFGGVFALAGFVLIAIIKRNPNAGIKGCNDDKTTKNDIRAADPKSMLGTLDAETQSRIAAIKADAISDALKRAKAKRRIDNPYR